MAKDAPAAPQQSPTRYADATLQLGRLDADDTFLLGEQSYGNFLDGIDDDISFTVPRFSARHKALRDLIDPTLSVQGTPVQNSFRRISTPAVRKPDPQVDDEVHETLHPSSQNMPLTPQEATRMVDRAHPIATQGETRQMAAKPIETSTHSSINGKENKLASSLNIPQNTSQVVSKVKAMASHGRANSASAIPKPSSTLSSAERLAQAFSAFDSLEHSTKIPVPKSSIMGYKSTLSLSTRMPTALEPPIRSGAIPDGQSLIDTTSKAFLPSQQEEVETQANQSNTLTLSADHHSSPTTRPTASEALPELPDSDLDNPGSSDEEPTTVELQPSPRSPIISHIEDELGAEGVDEAQSPQHSRSSTPDNLSDILLSNTDAQALHLDMLTEELASGFTPTHWIGEEADPASIPYEVPVHSSMVIASQEVPFSDDGSESPPNQSRRISGVHVSSQSPGLLTTPTTSISETRKNFTAMPRRSSIRKVPDWVHIVDHSHSMDDHGDVKMDEPTSTQAEQPASGHESVQALSPSSSPSPSPSPASPLHSSLHTTYAKEERAPTPLGFRHSVTPEAEVAMEILSVLPEKPRADIMVMGASPSPPRSELPSAASPTQRTVSPVLDHLGNDEVNHPDPWHDEPAIPGTLNYPDERIESQVSTLVPKPIAKVTKATIESAQNTVPEPKKQNLLLKKEHKVSKPEAKLAAASQAPIARKISSASLQPSTLTSHPSRQKPVPAPRPRVASSTNGPTSSGTGTSADKLKKSVERAIPPQKKAFKKPIPQPISTLKRREEIKQSLTLDPPTISASAHHYSPRSLWAQLPMWVYHNEESDEEPHSVSSVNAVVSHESHSPAPLPEETGGRAVSQEHIPESSYVDTRRDLESDFQPPQPPLHPSHWVGQSSRVSLQTTSHHDENQQITTFVESEIALSAVAQSLEPSDVSREDAPSRQKPTMTNVRGVENGTNLPPTTSTHRVPSAAQAPKLLPQQRTKSGSSSAGKDRPRIPSKTVTAPTKVLPQQKANPLTSQSRKPDRHRIGSTSQSASSLQSKTLSTDPKQNQAPAPAPGPIRRDLRKAYPKELSVSNTTKVVPDPSTQPKRMQEQRNDAPRVQVHNHQPIELPHSSRMLDQMTAQSQVKEPVQITHSMVSEAVVDGQSLVGPSSVHHDHHQQPQRGAAPPPNHVPEQHRETGSQGNLVSSTSSKRGAIESPKREQPAVRKRSRVEHPNGAQNVVPFPLTITHQVAESVEAIVIDDNDEVDAETGDLIPAGTAARERHIANPEPVVAPLVVPKRTANRLEKRRSLDAEDVGSRKRARVLERDPRRIISHNVRPGDANVRRPPRGPVHHPVAQPLAVAVPGEASRLRAIEREKRLKERLEKERTGKHVEDLTVPTRRPERPRSRQDAINSTSTVPTGSFTFATDVRAEHHRANFEARLAHWEIRSQEAIRQAQASKVTRPIIPDFAAMQSEHAHRVLMARQAAKQNITAPKTPALKTKTRVVQRHEFDEQIREKERLLRQLQEAEEAIEAERERLRLHELRKKLDANVKANPLPPWLHAHNDQGDEEDDE